MGDILFKDALRNALENIKGVNLTGDFTTSVEVLNAFNALYSCVVTFNESPDGATIVVRDANGNVVTADEGGTYTLREGSYKYDASAQYYTAKTNQTLNISQSDVTTGTKTVNVTLTRVDCVVTFATTPETATIVVKSGETTIEPDDDGNYILAAGSYTYDATAEGYTTITGEALVISASEVTSGTKTVTVTMTEVTP